MFIARLDTASVLISILILFTEWNVAGGSLKADAKRKDVYKILATDAAAASSSGYLQVRSRNRYAQVNNDQRQQRFHTVAKRVRPIVVERKLQSVQSRRQNSEPGSTTTSYFRVKSRYRGSRKSKKSHRRRNGKHKMRSKRVKLHRKNRYPVVKPSAARLRKVVNHYTKPSLVGNRPTKTAINVNKTPYYSTKPSYFTTLKPKPTTARRFITTLKSKQTPKKPPTTATYFTTSNIQTTKPENVIREVLTNQESLEKYGIKAPPGFRVVATRPSQEFDLSRPKPQNISTTHTSIPTGVQLSQGETHKPTKSSLFRIDTTSVDDAYDVLRGIGTGYRVRLAPTQALHKQVDFDVKKYAKPTFPSSWSELRTPATKHPSRHDVVLNDEPREETSGMRLLRKFLEDLNDLWHTPYPEEENYTTSYDLLQEIIPTRASTYDLIDENDRPWYNGSNVCRKESLKLLGLTTQVISRLKKTTICNEVWPNYICTEKFGGDEQSPTRRVVFHCCEGYEREGGVGKCIKKTPPTFLGERNGDEGGDKIAGFGTFGGETGNTEVITFFMPKDEVVDQYLLKSGLSSEHTDNVQNFLENHVVVGEHFNSTQLENNQIIEAHSTNKIRVNFFEPIGMMTVNCIPVSQRDVINGETIIHVIDDVIVDVAGSIYDYLLQNSDSFSILLRVINAGGLIPKLSQADGTFTLFAPTDTALLSDSTVSETRSCAESFVKQHLADNIICSNAIKDFTNISSVLGNAYVITRNFEDEVFVDDSRVIKRDIMAQNGVVHVIDSPLQSPTSRTVLDIARSNQNASLMLQLLEEGGVTDAIETSEDFTLVIPINVAFDLPSMYFENSIINPDALNRMLLFHFIPIRISLDDLKTKRSLTTMDPTSSLRLHSFYTKTKVRKVDSKVERTRKLIRTVQCARVLPLEDTSACNGNILYVNNLLLPPNGDILSTLQVAPQKNFSIFVRAIEIAGYTKLLKGESNMTIFAPTNRAFASLPNKFLRLIMRNVRMLRKIILFHVVKGEHCCDSLMQHAKQHRTLYGHPMTSCPKRNNLYLGRSKKRLRAMVHACDNVATNGIIHGINQMLIPVSLNNK